MDVTDGGLTLELKSAAARSRSPPRPVVPVQTYASEGDSIPLLTGQLYQGLIAQGEHLTYRCQGWTDAMVQPRGWAAEVA